MVVRKIKLIWLFCSLSALMYWPAAAIAEVIYKEVAYNAGLAYQQADLSPKLVDEVGALAMMSGGATAGDFDGDGDQDWFVSSIYDPLCEDVASCTWKRVDEPVQLLSDPIK